MAKLYFKYGAMGSSKSANALITKFNYEERGMRVWLIKPALDDRDGKHLYQWTAIDECTRVRFVYGFEEHTPENTVKFLKMLIKVFPFPIKTIQTDNGTEFTYKFISETEKSPMDKYLEKLGIDHVLIPPRTPWHNGKVERSHRNDQRYFYDWEKFRSVEELNEKLKEHLKWSNNKTMRTLGRKSPIQLLREKLAA